MTKTRLELHGRTTELSALEMITNGISAGTITAKKVTDDDALNVIRTMYPNMLSPKYAGKGLLARLYNSYGRSFMYRTERGKYEFAVN